MMTRIRNPILALCVTICLVVFITSPAPASMVPSRGASPKVSATTDIDAIQRALENKLVIEKLAAYGLTPDEVNSKLKDMTPTQIHMLAQASNDVLAGGDAIGFVIGILVIVILVIVVLWLMDKHVVLKMSSLDTPAYGEPVARG
jgi:hypothetical protein